MSKMPRSYKQAERWALRRIGKRVFRHALGCPCETCGKVTDEGVVIMDRMHAIYITDCAMEMGFRYADKKEEL